MRDENSIDERLRVLARQFGPREAVTEAVMAKVGLLTPRPAQRWRWAMRSTIGFGVAACVVIAVLLVNPPGEAEGFDLPGEGQLQWAPLGTLKDYDVTVTPSVAPYTIRPDMSNVEKQEALAYLTAEQRELLASNGFLILPSASKEFYEIYHKNAAPFVTADCVFHAYHVLLAETLRQAETLYLTKRQAALARAGHERMKKISASLPASLAPAARDALIYWAVADSLANPHAAISADVSEEVASELGRIREAKFIGRIEGPGPKRDYTVYSPIAGYEKSEELKKYFVLNRYFTLATQPFDSDRGATACTLIALAVGTSDDARAAYLDIARYREFLGGLGEDPTPITLLTAAREAFGGRVTHAALGDAGALAKLRKAIASQPRPTVADQPQDVPGADPMAGYGMRMFPPSVSVRALAYQHVAQARARTPRGEHMAAVLGTELPAVQADLHLLKEAKAELARRAGDPSRQDVHTLAMLALARLSGERGKGYPSFMGTGAWRIKTANTQMGAWSEIEHDLSLYMKDNTLYICAMRANEGFHGYVEPVPRFYAALAALVGRTGDAFEGLGAFRAISAGAPVRPKDADRWWRPPVIPTEGHFKALESLLLHLRDMAAKELQNRAFSEKDIQLLKGLGGQLRHLAFNDSTSPDAKEPMSVIVRIAREYLEEKGRYVGVGRPMKILAVVPYGGKLHWAVGGVYSYYEFDRPLRQPLTDREWKKITGAALAVQPYRPWLADKNVGLGSGRCSAETLRGWLPKKKVRIGNTYGGGACEQLLHDDGTMQLLNVLGSTRLTPEAMDLAGAAFADGRLYENVMAALYVLLRSAPAETRVATGAAAMREIEKEFAGSKNKLSSSNGRAWLYFTLRLLEGTEPDAKTLARIRAIRAQAQELIRQNYYARQMKELDEAAGMFDKAD